MCGAGGRWVMGEEKQENGRNYSLFLQVQTRWTWKVPKWASDDFESFTQITLGQALFSSSRVEIDLQLQSNGSWVLDQRASANSMMIGLPVMPLSRALFAKRLQM